MIVNEATATARRIPIEMRDSTTGVYTAGLTLSGTEVKIAINGGAYATASGAVTESGLGGYYYQASPADVSARGYIELVVAKTGYETWKWIEPIDPDIITTLPTASNIADAVWDEALIGHLSVGSTGETLNSAGAAGLTAATIADAVWDELATDHVITGTMGANLQVLADAVLIWPTPVGGGVAASTIIQRAMAISDMHDNFVSELEWLTWLNQEQYALRLFLARSGWALPFDTTSATITTSGWSLVTDGASPTVVSTTAAGHYVFTPTLADVMAVVSMHEVVSGSTRRLTYSNAVDFLRQTNGATIAASHATIYRARMYGNEIHLDFYPTPVSGETYLITYLSAPVPLTATTQAIALPMGWEERLVLGMARRALIKEESDVKSISNLISDMDSQIEQLCWSRVMSEAPTVRNTDPNLLPDFPAWQTWYWR